MNFVLIFHSNSGCTNVPQYYVIACLLTYNLHLDPLKTNLKKVAKNGHYLHVVTLVELPYRNVNWMGLKHVRITPTSLGCLASCCVIHSFFRNGSILTTYCRFRGLFLHLITLRHTTVCRTSLDERSARRRDL
jgi:hypothetical protein